MKSSKKRREEISKKKGGRKRGPNQFFFTKFGWGCYLGGHYVFS